VKYFCTYSVCSILAAFIGIFQLIAAPETAVAQEFNAFSCGTCVGCVLDGTPCPATPTRPKCATECTCRVRNPNKFCLDKSL